MEFIGVLTYMLSVGMCVCEFFFLVSYLGVRKPERDTFTLRNGIV